MPGSQLKTRIATPAPASVILDWNQIFIDTLIATNTANSSSQRLGAIVHTAIFDAYNGIEQRYTPVFVHNTAPDGASRRAAVVAAAYTALVGLFPSRQPALDDSYAASLAALSERLRARRPVEQTTALVRDAYRARHRLGNRGRAGRARLARERWVQRELPSVHRWDRGRPVAADTASVWTDERPGVGIHGDVRPGQQHPVRSRTAANARPAPRTRTISTPSRRSVARPDRRAPRTRRRSLPSGKATPASTGIRQRTRWRAPTACRCPTPTGFSRS